MTRDAIVLYGCPPPTDPSDWLDKTNPLITPVVPMDHPLNASPVLISKPLPVPTIASARVLAGHACDLAELLGYEMEMSIGSLTLGRDGMEDKIYPIDQGTMRDLVRKLATEASEHASKLHIARNDALTAANGVR